MKRERAMSDENLPLAEMLTERASLAIENAKLYTEQVEARRKVEDLSRLKDDTGYKAPYEIPAAVADYIKWLQAGNPL